MIGLEGDDANWMVIGDGEMNGYDVEEKRTKMQKRVKIMDVFSTEVNVVENVDMNRTRARKILKLGDQKNRLGETRSRREGCLMGKW